MKELIPMNEFGLMAGSDFVARVDSRVVAETFEKQHFHVLRDIEKLIEPKSGLSEEFRKSNFGFSVYTTEQGHEAKCCLLTRDGFTMPPEIRSDSSAYNACRGGSYGAAANSGRRVSVHHAGLPATEATVGVVRLQMA